MSGVSSNKLLWHGDFSHLFVFLLTTGAQVWPRRRGGGRLRAAAHLSVSAHDRGRRVRAADRHENAARKVPDGLRVEEGRAKVGLGFVVGVSDAEAILRLISFLPKNEATFWSNII